MVVVLSDCLLPDAIEHRGRNEHRLGGSLIRLVYDWLGCVVLATSGDLLVAILRRDSNTAIFSRSY